MTHDDESAVVARAVAGDREAFGTLYERHYPGMLKHIQINTRRSPDAEDLTQTLFLRVWKAMPHYEDRGYDFASYLIRCADRLVIDRVRLMRSRSTLPLDFGATLPMDADADTVPGFDVNAAVDRFGQPEAAAEIHEQCAAVRVAWTQLRQERRAVVQMQYFDGMPGTQIARVLGKSESCVRLIAFRARAEMRRALARQAVTA